MHRHGLPGEVGESLSLEVLQSCEDVVLRDVSSGLVMNEMTLVLRDTPQGSPALKQLPVFLQLAVLGRAV